MISIMNYDWKQIKKSLLTWYQCNQRDLAWRRTKNPYEIWISEIMLQQTRVEAVKDYYKRFLDELPDLESLSQVDDERLLKLWEGLGYYNRARNLKKAACTIMTEYNGLFPSAYDDVLSLSGIGEYTAGAICSICYDAKTPAVDGNVLRVMTRLSNWNAVIDDLSTKREARQMLLCLYETGDCGKLTQALMELGAMVCVPNGAPHCEACPWQELCVAKKEQLIDQIPVKTKAKKRRIENRTIFIIRQGDTVAIQKRPNKGLLAGLYELPGAEGSLSEQEALEWVKEQGYGPLYIKKLPDSKHIFSHIEWHMTGYLIKIEDTEIKKAPEKHIFVDAVTATEKYAIPSAFLAYASYFKKIDE